MTGVALTQLGAPPGKRARVVRLVGDLPLLNSALSFFLYLWRSREFRGAARFPGLAQEGTGAEEGRSAGGGCAGTGPASWTRPSSPSDPPAAAAAPPAFPYLPMPALPHSSKTGVFT